MLDRAHRLTSGRLFAAAIRRGRRAGTTTLVVHWLADAEKASSERPAQVGLVVSKAVGNAVTRNHVKRRVRHLVRDRLSVLPAGCVLVIRALPAASAASSAALGGDLDRALRRVLTRGSAR